jgi:hypothetical protein
MEQSVPKRGYIKFRHRGITQKETYNIPVFSKPSVVEEERNTSVQNI